MNRHIQTKLFRLCAAVLLAAALLSVAAFGSFTDVRDTDYYSGSVRWAVENGVTDGVSPTRFAPNEACTRAQIVTFLWKLAGRPSVDADVAFSDVKPGSWYDDAVRWAVAEHVTDGVTPTEFAPNRVCTRAEGVAFLYKFYGREPVSGILPFSDVAASSWYHDAVLWAVQRGVVNGVSPVRYDPQGVFTRAHIVTMLHRAETKSEVRMYEGVYLGVENYGSVADPMTAYHLFQVNDLIYRLSLPTDPNVCAFQNYLHEGGVYRMWERSGALLSLDALSPKPLETSLPPLSAWRIRCEAGRAVATATNATLGEPAVEWNGTAYLPEPVQPYAPPVSGTPGRVTAKNFLSTALMPCGTTLYVYGGGWNWQDTGAGSEAVTIGLPESWLRFYQNHNERYTYKSSDAARSYYPFGGYNQYGHEGLDCSGFVGWAVYNTVRTESGGAGFVVPAANQARLLADSGLGTCTGSVGTLRPGDVFSMRGHVWISLGTCADGSILILHSTPSDSRAGTPGGGVQLSAIGTSTSCEAYRLAERYMSAYYPDWYARYGVKLCAPGSYTACVGHFTWSAGYDPDGYRSMTPAAILRDLFGA